MGFILLCCLARSIDPQAHWIPTRTHIHTRGYTNAHTDFLGFDLKMRLWCFFFPFVFIWLTLVRNCHVFFLYFFCFLFFYSCCLRVFVWVFIIPFTFTLTWVFFALLFATTCKICTICLKEGNKNLSSSLSIYWNSRFANFAACIGFSSCCCRVCSARVTWPGQTFCVLEKIDNFCGKIPTRCGARQESSR